jgi:hypothetical protein
MALPDWLPFDLSVTSWIWIRSIVSKIEQSLADITLTKPEHGEHLQVERTESYFFYSSSMIYLRSSCSWVRCCITTAPKGLSSTTTTSTLQLIRPRPSTRYQLLSMPA